MTLGQEFAGYAAQIALAQERVRSALVHVGQIPLGGTATGTGLNTHARFAEKVRARLRKESGLRQIAPPADPFEAQANRDAPSSSAKEGANPTRTSPDARALRSTRPATCSIPGKDSGNRTKSQPIDGANLVETSGGGPGEEFCPFGLTTRFRDSFSNKKIAS